VNIAGAKVALVASEGDDPDIQLLVARVPISQESGRKQVDRILDTIALGADEEELKVKSVKREYKNLCGTSTEVLIREGMLKYPDASPKATVVYRASVNVEDSRYVVNLLTNAKDFQTAAAKAGTVFDSLQCKQ
jgi:hypothetical protein